MAEEAAGVEEVRRRQMEEEVGAEVRLGWRHGPEEGEAGGSPDWAGEAEERTCLGGTGAGEEVRRRGLWRGAGVAGRCGRGREEEVVGWSCDGGVVEEGHLWMEVEEVVQDLQRPGDGESWLKCLVQEK